MNLDKSTESISHPDVMGDSIRSGVIGWMIKAIITKTVVGIILFLSAGRLDWIWGWAYWGVYAGFDLASALVLIPRDPQLLIERSNIRKGGKIWDQVIVRLASGYLPMAAWVVAGLDFRYGWAQVAIWLHLAGLAAAIAGHAIMVWAMASNTFFSITYRIQSERGHAVVSGGPYRFVRHPGYAGAILFTLGMPFLLGSWWSLIPGILSAALFVLRTSLEDKTLQAELPGYLEYTREVRSRLLPGIW
jgi:protein-S-isoprenylcysteine O-methyltransferase Ste14